MTEYRPETGRRGYSAGFGVALATPEPDAALAAQLVTRILFRDDHLLVLDKPSGLAVHPGPKTPESLENYLGALQFERKAPPQPAHRLDRDTSGCLVLGRTKGALRALNQQFVDHAITKTYWAVVVGGPAAASGEIDVPLEKTSSPAGGWRMAVVPTGKPALTCWRVLARSTGLAWLELTPQTGRTHQIRIHCAHVGMPLLGDLVYGTAVPGTRTMLHARQLSIPRLDGTLLTVVAPAPADWPEPIEPR